PYASQASALLEQGRDAAQEAARPENSWLRLVAVNTAGEYLAPPLIQAYRQLHPGVSVLLEVGNRATVFERLESRRADIGIGGRAAGGGGCRGTPVGRRGVDVVEVDNAARAPDTLACC